MSYTDRPAGRVVETAPAVAVADYHDRVRWGPILAGLVIALSSQLVLTGLGAAIGLTTLAGSGAPRSNAGDVGLGVGIWSIISLLISLFLGGWVTARACGPMNRSTALLNGAILWATTLAISAWLLASGVSGAFGVLASNAGDIINQAQQSGATVPPGVTDPNVTADQARDAAGNAAKVGWSFALGSLLGLVASLVGASVGTRHPRTTTTVVNS
ncbi:hypothetical protein H6G89_07725 [Oscillatoria sp. FACHB-1407]|uniref:hypothetical protein n=1 Tax=Oscillatoria sp. FACHB-1407 TaxID=2692847 RepID=UPI001684943F|nr:hypothetical protein [Oscillatoria sp. FACHB-1407]MBD2460931.1 hypothetical protein [Oscillatoria sp. FACHB-1407]